MPVNEMKLPVQSVSASLNLRGTAHSDTISKRRNQERKREREREREGDKGELCICQRMIHTYGEIISPITRNYRTDAA